MNLKNFRNGFLALVGAGAIFLTSNNGDSPSSVSALSGGPPVADTTIYLSCKDEVKMFQIFPGPQDFPEIDTDKVDVDFPLCDALNLTNGLPFNQLCVSGSFGVKNGNSCNHAMTPWPYCIMQDSTKNGANFSFSTKHGTVISSFSVHYVLPLKNTQSITTNQIPNVPKQLVAKLLDENGNEISRKVVNLPVDYPKDTSWWVNFDFGIYLNQGKNFNILVFGRDPKFPNDPLPLWDFYDVRAIFLCSALGNFCQWGPAKKVWEESNGCEKIMYYEWTSSCGDKFVAKYVLTDRDAPLVANKPKDVTLSLYKDECEMEYFVPSISFDDCDKNASVEITAPTLFQGSIRGNGGYVPGYVYQGKWPITYTITDACGNSASCTYTLYVKETDGFNLACDGITVVSLNDSCVLTPAKVFIQAISGLCCTDHKGNPLVNVYGMRMDNGKGGLNVPFCCSDVGKNVTIMLTVVSQCDTNVRQSCMVQVEVQNKMAPRITCPRDITVSCDTFDLSNLSNYGKAVATANCGVSVKDTFVDLRTMCHVGSIVRTFTATGSNGMTAVCSQTITVVDTKQFNESNITWPRDTVLFGCGVSFDKSLTGQPKFTYPGCSKSVGASCTDEVFYFRKNGKCKAIFRTWKVIDWCNFNPQTGPYWTHIQYIHVMDSVKPVITFCPKDTSIGNFGACSDSVLVNLGSVTATDCGGIMRITNDSKYSFQKGANASGKYPNGTHKITYTVYDSCGVTNTCSTTITVSDKKAPTLLCINLATDIQNCPPMGVGAKVAVNQFILKKEDNCCPSDRIIASFSKDSLVDTLYFDCSQIGLNVVEVWITDCNGNQEVCKPTIDIQDNFNLCPPTFRDTLMVAGALVRPNGKGIEFVEVSLDTFKMVCDNSYKFDSLAPQTHLVKPYKDEDPLEGVSTRDIVLIQRHILGLYPLTPYQMIAADVTKSNSITTADISELRRLILGIIPAFTNNTSWRFVPQGYVFPNGNMNWNFPEFLSIGYGSPPGDVLNADFFGIKIGDVDGSANTFTNDDDEYQYLSVKGSWLPESHHVILEIPEEFGQPTITVADLQGRVVRVSPKKDGENLMIDLKKYPTGVYLISVSTENWDEPYYLKVLKL